MDRRAQRRTLLGPDDRDRHPQHVGVQLHQRVVAQQASGDDELAHGHAGHPERLDDHARTECGRFQQCPISLLGPGAQRLADHQPRQRGVDEHGTVPVDPVERDEAVRAGRLGERQRREVVVDRLAGVASRPEVALRHLGVDVPGEDVTDPGLSGLVTERTGEDATVDDAAHPGHLDELVVVHHVTGRRTHDGQHLPGLDRPCRGRRHVRVDVADRDRDADREARPDARPAP